MSVLLVCITIIRGLGILLQRYGNFLTTCTLVVMNNPLQAVTISQRFKWFIRNSYSNHINHNRIFPLFRFCYMTDAATTDFCCSLFCDQKAVFFPVVEQSQVSVMKRTGHWICLYYWATCLRSWPKKKAQENNSVEGQRPRPRPCIWGEGALFHDALQDMMHWCWEQWR